MKLELQDTYLIENSFNLMDPSPLFVVYQRLCGASAVILYGYLLTQGRTSEDGLHAALCPILGTTLSQLNTDLNALQSAGLLEIRQQKLSETTRFLYTLKAPLPVALALRHDVLGRAFLKLVGPGPFESLRSTYGESSLARTGYEEVKAEADKTFMQSWSPQEEALFANGSAPRPQAEDLSFDLKTFLRDCSPIIFPLRKRTEKALKEIREIGSVYGLSIRRMIELVGMAHVENDPEFNTEKLRKLASREESPDVPELANPYEYPPVIFLKRLRGGIEATSLEKYVLNNLVAKAGLNPVVVNVLVEANFRHYKSKLSTKALEETALQWAVLNIRTQQEAQAQIPLSFALKGRRVELVSDYTKEAPVVLSDEEQAAIKASFKKLGK